MKPIVVVLALLLCVAPALADDSESAHAKTFRSLFIKTVDKAITGDQIAARPLAFIGRNVDLRCTVEDTTYPDWFDAKCHTRYIEIEAPGYRQYIKRGQTVHVLGIVDKWGGFDEWKFSVVQALFVREVQK